MLVDLKAEINARTAGVQKVYVTTPEIKEAFELLDQTRNARRQNGGAYCSLLTGLSGCGKTRIFEMYRDHEPIRNDGSIPILLLSVPSPFTFGGFLSEFLTAMHVEDFAGSQNVNKMRRRVLLYLERFKVELILLEEASHIIDKKERTAKIPYWATDVIKSDLLDKAKIPIVMNGVPVAAELFRINPQLETRRLETIRLAPYDWDNAVSRARFMLLCEAFEQAAGFSEQIVANDENLCLRIHRATRGIHGLMAKFFMKATEVGIRASAASLNTAVLAEGCAKLADPDGHWVNPFLVQNLQADEAGDETRVTALHKRGLRDKRELG